MTFIMDEKLISVKVTIPARADRRIQKGKDHKEKKCQNEVFHIKLA